jgi:hypothetical protein
MGGGRKRRRRDGSETPSMHPRNRYAAAAPDFAALAELYPSFRPFVSVSGSGRASVDFTDFSSTRELTRVLLLHDHGVNWLVSLAPPPPFTLPPSALSMNPSMLRHGREKKMSPNIIPCAEFAAVCDCTLHYAHGTHETNKYCDGCMKLQLFYFVYFQYLGLIRSKLLMSHTYSTN